VYYSVGLQLYCELKLLTREPSNQIMAYHVESTTLDDGDYELVPETEQGFSEDPVSVVETLTEAPNQSSEIFDTPAPRPRSRRQAPMHNPVFQITTLCNLILIYYVLH
jgi:hypothetical protein